MASSITERYFFNPYLDYDLHSEKPLSSVFVAEWSSFIEDFFNAFTLLQLNRRIAMVVFTVVVWDLFTHRIIC